MRVMNPCHLQQLFACRWQIGLQWDFLQTENILCLLPFKKAANTTGSSALGHHSPTKAHWAHHVLVPAWEKSTRPDFLEEEACSVLPRGVRAGVTWGLAAGSPAPTWLRVVIVIRGLSFVKHQHVNRGTKTWHSMLQARFLVNAVFWVVSRGLCQPLTISVTAFSELLSCAAPHVVPNCTHCPTMAPHQLPVPAHLHRTMSTPCYMGCIAANNPHLQPRPCPPEGAMPSVQLGASVK